MTALAAEASEAASTAGQWWVVVGTIVLLFAALVVFALTTQAGVIARATMKEAVRQPVFALLMGISIVILLVNTFLPFFSLGEDIKMLKDCGLATILISGLLLAIWTASTSIADEIEGKTAMTLLSKPITRRQFIVGKYFGIIQAVFLMLVPVMLSFLFFIYFKVGYDAQESGQEVPEWFAWTVVNWAPFELPLPDPERWHSVVHILPGLVLIFLEITVLAAISVAISTRLPMIVNMVTCFAIFVIGHLTPVLVQTGVLRLEFVSFMARLIAAVLPSLEVFNMQAAVATGALVPPVYLGMSALYCAAYVTGAILLAFILFEDRDLA